MQSVGNQHLYFALEQPKTSEKSLPIPDLGLTQPTYIMTPPPPPLPYIMNPEAAPFAPQPYAIIAPEEPFSPTPPPPFSTMNPQTPPYVPSPPLPPVTQRNFDKQRSKEDTWRFKLDSHSGFTLEPINHRPSPQPVSLGLIPSEKVSGVKETNAFLRNFFSSQCPPQMTAMSHKTTAPAVEMNNASHQPGPNVSETAPVMPPTNKIMQRHFPVKRGNGGDPALMKAAIHPLPYINPSNFTPGTNMQQTAAILPPPKMTAPPHVPTERGDPSLTTFQAPESADPSFQPNLSGSELEATNHPIDQINPFNFGCTSMNQLPVNSLISGMGNKSLVANMSTDSSVDKTEPSYTQRGDSPHSPHSNRMPGHQPHPDKEDPERTALKNFYLLAKDHDNQMKAKDNVIRDLMEGKAKLEKSLLDARATDHRLYMMAKEHDSQMNRLTEAVRILQGEKADLEISLHQLKTQNEMKELNVGIGVVTAALKPVFRALECICCYEVRGNVKIFQCCSGHLICHFCRRDLPEQTCPACTGKYTQDIRCLLAEELANILKLNG